MIDPDDRARIVVNGAFRPQRVTGQQRYAREIADRMVAAGATEVEPHGFWARTALRTWLWSQLVLPWRTREAVLVSLTVRAPIWHPRQVLAVHDLFVMTNPEWYSRKYVWTHVPMMRLQLRSASAVVAVSAPIAGQVRAARGDGATVPLAPNAPSDQFQHSEPAPQLLERLGLRAGAFLLAIGSLDPRKNLDRLAAAWGRVPEASRAACPLVVVGGGAAIYAQRAVDWPTGTVSAGYLTDAELASLYAVTRGVVFVSLAEGFGLPIVEAAAAGVERFVLSDIEVFHWIAGDGATYVDPLSVDQMSTALQAVAEGSTTIGSPLDVSRFRWDESAAAVMTAARGVALEER